MKRFVILILCAALLLTGCGATNSLGFHGIIPYDQMEYVRPDLDELEQLLAESCQTALDGESLEDVVDGIWAFYDAYDLFYDQYNLAYIRYNSDMTDFYWQKEYEFCSENAYTLEAGLEELYCALAASPLREELEGDDYFGAGFFDSYEGGSSWDAEFMALLDQETALVNAYYELSSQASDEEAYSDAYFDTYAEALCQNYVDLIAIRQEIAAYWGYDSYPEFAYDFYYYRDYTWEEADAYLAQIQQELVPVYRRMNQSDVWNLTEGYCSTPDTYDYLRCCAKEMGGTVQEAFALLDQAELYDIEYSETKNDTAFELFFYTYYQPFIFMCPSQTVLDKLTFVHEFGHFCNDYASSGSVAGIDVCEVFSQGMEYLSLCYSENAEDLTRLKMADSLCTYVEQAAYAAFEQQVYSLTGDDLTTENVFALYREICTAYGFESWDWDSLDLVTIPHFYTDPMYIISYVVSNDVALQLYQIEQQESGAGLAVFEENLTTEESYFLAFVESAGLESPFAQGRLPKVRETMESIFGS